MNKLTSAFLATTLSLSVFSTPAFGNQPTAQPSAKPQKNCVAHKMDFAQSSKPFELPLGDRNARYQANIYTTTVELSKTVYFSEVTYIMSRVEDTVDAAVVGFGNNWIFSDGNGCQYENVTVDAVRYALDKGASTHSGKVVQILADGTQKLVYANVFALWDTSDDLFPSMIHDVTQDMAPLPAVQIVTNTVTVTQVITVQICGLTLYVPQLAK